MPLADEDRARMARLYEEITGRLIGLGMIVARTLGEYATDTTDLRFHHVLTEAFQQPRDDIEIIHFSNCQVGCYDNGAGECFPC